MAIRVNLTKALVEEALQKSIDSAKRLQNTTKNPQFKEIAEQQLRLLNAAIADLQEIK